MSKYIDKKKKRFWYFIVVFINISLNTITKVYAEDNPVTIINNLSDMIFQLITAIGGIILGISVVQFGLSFKSHDPSQRANSILGILGGIIIVCAKVILNTITK